MFSVFSFASRLTYCRKNVTFINERNIFVTFGGVMLRKLTKGTALGLCMALLFLGISQEVLAAGVSSVLPSGGIGAALSDGVTLENIQGSTENSDVEIATMVEPTEADIEEVQVPAVVETADEELENVVVAKVKDFVKVRGEASERSAVIGKFYENAVGLILAEEDGWYQIQSGNVIGYVKKEYCISGVEAQALATELGTRMAQILCDRLMVRYGAYENAKVMGMVALNDTLIVTGETEGWVRVEMEEGDGWISKDYVRVYTDYIRAETTEEEQKRLEKEAEDKEKARIAAAKMAIFTVEKTDETEMGIAVAKYAIQFIGNPYVWGGESLTEGVDCSGFIMKVYEHFGVELPHSSAAHRSAGYAVKGLENALPGDLICYSGHVALYIGDGQIVHASSEKTGIKVSKADYRQILAIRRIF